MPQHYEDLYFELRGEVREYLNMLEAQTILANGFIGMGKNIMQEKAGRIPSQLRRLKKLLDKS